MDIIVEIVWRIKVLFDNSHKLKCYMFIVFYVIEVDHFSSISCSERRLFGNSSAAVRSQGGSIDTVV